VNQSYTSKIHTKFTCCYYCTHGVVVVGGGVVGVGVGVGAGAVGVAIQKDNHY